MTTWGISSDGSTSWQPIQLRYSVWDLGLSRWDTDQTESFWDVTPSTTYTPAADGTTVWA